MVTMLVYSLRRRETQPFARMVKEIFAYLSEEELNLHCFCAPALLTEFLEQGPLLDLACIGVVGKEESGNCTHRRSFCWLRTLRFPRWNT